MKKLLIILFFPMMAYSQTIVPDSSFLARKYALVQTKTDTIPVFFVASKKVPGQIHDPVVIIPGYVLIINTKPYNIPKRLNAAKQPLRKDIKVIITITKDEFDKY